MLNSLRSLWHRSMAWKVFLVGATLGIAGVATSIPDLVASGSRSPLLAAFEVIFALISALGTAALIALVVHVMTYIWASSSEDGNRLNRSLPADDGGTGSPQDSALPASPERSRPTSRKVFFAGAALSLVLSIAWATSVYVAIASQEHDGPCGFMGGCLASEPMLWATLNFVVVFGITMALTIVIAAAYAHAARRDRRP